MMIHLTLCFGLSLKLAYRNQVCSLHTHGGASGVLITTMKGRVGGVAELGGLRGAWVRVRREGLGKRVP